jgi:hypothetical protein
VDGETGARSGKRKKRRQNGNEKKENSEMLANKEKEGRKI